MIELKELIGLGVILAIFLTPFVLAGLAKRKK